MNDDKLWLAKQLDDHTGGNSTILVDWGNFTIDCKAGIAPSTDLKNLLSEMAKDYVRLREKEVETQTVVVPRNVALNVVGCLFNLGMWYQVEPEGDGVKISVSKRVIEDLNKLIKELNRG